MEKSYDDSQHLTAQQMLEFNSSKEVIIPFNDHLKTCAYCAEQSREMEKEILSGKIVVTDWHSKNKAKATDKGVNKGQNCFN